VAKSVQRGVRTSACRICFHGCTACLGLLLVVVAAAVSVARMAFVADAFVIGLLFVLFPILWVAGYSAAKVYIMRDRSNPANVFVRAVGETCFCRTGRATNALSAKRVFVVIGVNPSRPCLSSSSASIYLETGGPVFGTPYGKFEPLAADLDLPPSGPTSALSLESDIAGALQDAIGSEVSAGAPPGLVGITRFHRPRSSKDTDTIRREVPVRPQPASAYAVVSAPAAV
jgi:hypothetical protein